MESANGLPARSVNTFGASAPRNRKSRIDHPATPHQSTTMKTITYRIKADYGYYSNTHNAPQNGYLMDDSTYDRHTGREHAEPLTFDSVEAAHKHLTSEHDGYTHGTGCEYDGDGTYSMAGTYETRHGQHSRPRYTIVNAKSGRSNKSIITACEILNNQKA